MIDLSIMQYDSGTQSAESRAAGEGPCIHHFAVEVNDLASAEREIRAYGCEIISDPGVVPVKFRAPGGTVCEIVPRLRYTKVKAKAGPKKTPAKTKAKAKPKAKKSAKKK
jgi:lactoylglutathione lyase